MTLCKEIPLCIVNDHSDIVPFILACIRAKKLPATGSPILHFDAHPDMAVPTPVDLSYDSVQHFKDPRSLFYDVLSSEGCIGEFLIPMLYQRWISSVIWVRSPWSKQIPDGCHEFYIGNEYTSGRVAVDLLQSYYMDDHVVVKNSAELQYCEKVQLHVCEAHNVSKAMTGVTTAMSNTLKCTPVTSNNTIQVNDSKNDIPWILDICLDYFSTNNPFLGPLKRTLKTSIEEAAATAASERSNSDLPQYHGQDIHSHI